MFKVKEFKNEENSDDGRIIWTTEKVEKVLEDMETGYNIAEHPFYEADPNYKKGNIVFNYTNEEMDEIKLCAKDIVHFANTHCQVMTDEGYKKIKLRDYQEKVLKNYQNSRFSIFLAARQIGKCSFFVNKIKIRNKLNKKEQEICIGDLYYSQIDKKNLSLLTKIKLFLYKLI